MKAKVYFTKNITEKSLIKMYDVLDAKLKGKVGVKISTGEPGGHNFLNPKLISGLVNKLDGTIVENCTAYGGKRQDSKEHWQAIKDHGFMDIAPCDIMDEFGEIELPLVDGKHLKKNIVGEHIKNYDSILMLSHFKGHVMGGFGGALKNMSIGMASTKGKLNIHSAGRTLDQKDTWANLPLQNDFLESMAEADKTIMDYEKGNIVFINVMNNLSVDCDCNANPEDPCMKDIGILSSLDPVALDKACMDLIYASKDPGRDHFLERVHTRNGEHILGYAESLGVGSLDYELIDVD